MTWVFDEEHMRMSLGMPSRLHVEVYGMGTKTEKGRAKDVLA